MRVREGQREGGREGGRKGGRERGWKEDKKGVREKEGERKGGGEKRQTRKEEWEDRELSLKGAKIITNLICFLQ